LPKLLSHSFQGDSSIRTLSIALGVQSDFENGLLRLRKTTCEQELRWDFTDCPDLAQTVAVVCAAKNIKGYFTGLESLRIKETDRILALQNELRKIGADLVEDDRENWRLVPSQSLPASASFLTYKDHRMAMAFAPLATMMDVEIENPNAVRKSYPNFWNDMKNVGFALQPSANVLK
jgi:3-phosphoshikimate 1-carboxyvinyltransferase